MRERGSLLIVAITCEDHEREGEKSEEKRREKTCPPPACSEIKLDLVIK